MEFPKGTTAVLVNGKHVPIDEYLASLGETEETAVSPTKVGAKKASLEPFARDVAEIAGAPHLVDALEVAGFVTAASIRDASIDDLTAVSGIGKATAAKLKTAAEELLS